MRTRRNVIQHRDDGHFSDPAESDELFAVLRRFLGVGFRQFAVGLGQRAEVFRGVFQSLLRIEIARDDQHGVIGLVVFLVELFEIFDGHALDVRPVADGRLPVVMPLERRRHHLLAEHRSRAVFALFKFIPHHGHFRGQIFALDVAVHHAVGFQPDGELQVLWRCGQGLIVIGAVHPGRAVVLCPALGEDFGNLGMRGRALEDHVLQEMGHARFAITFVPRADEHRQVDRNERFGIVREQQHPEAVFKLVFGNSLNRGDHLGSRFIGNEGIGHAHDPNG